MRVALISLGKSLNYGGSLQSYALVYAINKYKKGVFCEYLDYHRNVCKDAVIWFSRKVGYWIMGRDDSPSWTIKEFFEIICTRSKAGSSSSAKEFRKFWQLTDYTRKLGRTDLRKIENNYDFFVIGSDQVWNCGRLNLDTTYLLDFVRDKRKKGCYAPSVAMKQIPEKYKKQYYRYWNEFEYLSCREQEGARLIEDMTDHKVECVLDPTLLLHREDWESVADISDVPRNEKYLLLYMMSESKSLVRFAEKLAKRKNIEIVKIYGDIQKNSAIGPKQWLGYFLNAEYVVTNSFHGVAFSINFNKNFYAEITPKAFFVASSSRIIDFLEELGLKNRLLNDTKENEIEKAEDIEYVQVNKKLEAMREKSVRYLLNMLGD